MKLDFTKNRGGVIALCVVLIIVLVLLAFWKQQGSTRVLEGMIMMDFMTPSNPESGTTLSDMDLQGYISAMIPFEKKFETAEKAKSAIKEKYTDGFVYDPSGNDVTGEINLQGLSSNSLDRFIKHLESTSKAFQHFADALTKMKKGKIDEAMQAKQAAQSAAQSAAPV